nr:hypothetical protein [Kibdelosporangium sp. MJ126-NF4]
MHLATRRTRCGKAWQTLELQRAHGVAPLRRSTKRTYCGTASGGDPGAAILGSPTDADAPFGEEVPGQVGDRIGSSRV